MNNKLWDWIKSHKIATSIICLCFGIFQAFIIHALHKWDIGIPFFAAEWNPGDVLVYVSGFEAFAGTVFLGVLTLWQNKRFKDENDKSQERLQQISEGQAKALEQILLMDQSSNIPLVDIKKHPKDDKLVNVELFLKEDRTASLKIFLTNITEYPIKDIHVRSLELYTYDFKYIIDGSKSSYNPHKGLPGHYDTHVAFKLLPLTYKEKNEYFVNVYPARFLNKTPQENAVELVQNQQFILEVTFEIGNIYGKKIVETIICEFRGNYSRNPDEHSFTLWNKELRFEVTEGTDNA